MPSPIDADLSGKTAIVTGASTGIGKVIARNLAGMGARVILACKSEERGSAAALEIRRSGVPGALDVEVVDLSNQASIRAFAGRVLANVARIDLLVNNAAVWLTSRQTTEEGVERTWATNVLGYHLLTRLLVDRVKASAPARIVNVASELARDLDLDDPEFQRRPYRGIMAYAQSKQADRMLTWSLARRLEGTRVTANAVHPGGVATQIMRDFRGVLGWATRRLLPWVLATPEQGADSATWLAASPEANGASGKFFVDRKERPCRFRDEFAIERLWELCERMTRRSHG